MAPEWWQNSSLVDWLNQALEHVNRGHRARQSPLETCRTLFEGLNVLWNAHSRQQPDLSDHKRLRSLLDSIPVDRKTALLGTRSVETLASLTPWIENHAVLKDALAYRPGQPTPAKVQKKATIEHCKLLRDLQKWKTSSTDENRGQLIKRLVDLLYVVRSNIAHGEKSPQRARDAQVCGATMPVLDEMFSVILDRPWRLVVLADAGELLSSGSSIAGEVLSSAGVPRSVDGMRVNVVSVSFPSTRPGGVHESDYWRAWVPVRLDGTEHTSVVTRYCWQDEGFGFVEQPLPHAKS